MTLALFSNLFKRDFELRRSIAGYTGPREIAREIVRELDHDPKKSNPISAGGSRHPTVLYVRRGYLSTTTFTIVNTGARAHMKRFTQNNAVILGLLFCSSP